MQKAEANADKQIQPLIDAFRAQGQQAAANELSVFMDLNDAPKMVHSSGDVKKLE